MREQEINIIDAAILILTEHVEYMTPQAYERFLRYKTQWNRHRNLSSQQQTYLCGFARFAKDQGKIPHKDTISYDPEENKKRRAIRKDIYVKPKKIKAKKPDKKGRKWAYESK